MKFISSAEVGGRILCTECGKSVEYVIFFSVGIVGATVCHDCLKNALADLAVRVSLT